MSELWMMHLVRVPIAFPEGVSAGAGADHNTLRVTRTASGTPIVRGSSWAGVLRAALARHGLTAAQLSQWFGEPLGARQTGRPRGHHVAVHDTELLSSGGVAAQIVPRTHNAIDRHDGTGTAHSLFTVESAAPHAVCELRLVIKSTSSDADEAEVRTLVQALSAAFTDGVMVGGSRARGVGLARLQDGKAIQWNAFDLSDPIAHGQWLDVRAGHATSGGATRQVSAPADGSRGDASGDLVVTVVLRVPPGQDILCGDGSAGELALEVQSVDGADGKAYFRMPGSSIRGIFRAWFARLAARDGQPVAYSHGRALEGRLDGAQAANVDPASCVVTSLFGSAKRAGRIHIADALTPHTGDVRALRTHVSVDHAWATSREGMLFTNAVLTSNAGPFTVRMRISSPTEHEVGWLARTLRAVHLGVIRIGSSKAAGRVEIESCEAKGLHADRLKMTDLVAGRTAGAVR